eukprot:3210981-Prymnesium_polylepis.2
MSGVGRGAVRARLVRGVCEAAWRLSESRRAGVEAEMHYGCDPVDGEFVDVRRHVSAVDAAHGCEYAAVWCSGHCLVPCGGSHMPHEQSIVKALERNCGASGRIEESTELETCHEALFLHII